MSTPVFTVVSGADMDVMTMISADEGRLAVVRVDSTAQVGFMAAADPTAAAVTDKTRTFRV
jgi:hypothetical protein